ncbi:MAG: hypothetical protein Q8N51_19930, partial [Gammaproteobacteria bacterium]|nr:hypothetical protein [Gammaproteobacteria bacterium]
ALYRAPAASAPAEPAAPVPRARVSWGLVLMFVVFLGQTGFWAYSIQQVTRQGVTAQESAYAVAFCKAVAGCYLLARMNGKPASHHGVRMPGLVVMAAVAAMSFAQDLAGFLVGMLAWELGFNILSARLQALVTQDNPTIAGRWLAGSVILGAAAGPALHGMALAAGAGGLFIMLSVLSPLLPWCWVSLRRWRSKENALAA